MSLEKQAYLPAGGDVGYPSPAASSPSPGLWSLAPGFASLLPVAPGVVQRSEVPLRWPADCGSPPPAPEPLPPGAELYGLKRCRGAEELHFIASEVSFTQLFYFLSHASTVNIESKTFTKVLMK